MLADETQLTIVVRDHGVRHPAATRTRAERAALGLGLPLIAALSDAFELNTATNGDSAGTEVRMTFLYERETDPAEENPITGGPGPTVAGSPERAAAGARRTRRVDPSGRFPRPKGVPMTVRASSTGILSDENTEKREELVELLKKAYWMEIETVMSYITNSINPDGVRAQEIIESLQEDIQEELGHAQQFAQRIKDLYGVVPGVWSSRREQTYLQPPEHQTDVVHVIKGVIEAETGAIEHYNEIIEFTEGARPRDQRHGHRDPPRRGGPPPALRGLPARVRGRGPGLERQAARRQAPGRRADAVAPRRRGERRGALLSADAALEMLEWDCPAVSDAETRGVVSIGTSGSPASHERSTTNDHSGSTPTRTTRRPLGDTHEHSDGDADERAARGTAPAPGRARRAAATSATRSAARPRRRPTIDVGDRPAPVAATPDPDVCTRTSAGMLTLTS